MSEQLPKAAGNPKPSLEEKYDFEEVSDCCDFGYVLVPRDDAKAPPAPKPAE